MEIELLVLANSKKNNGRCLAGMNVETGELIRPVPNRFGNELPSDFLTINEYTLRPGDLISIAVTEPAPLLHQPENWLMEKKIELVEKDATKNFTAKLWDEILNPNILLMRDRDRISRAEIEVDPPGKSLGLVLSKQVRFFTNDYGAKKATLDLKGHSRVSSWTLSDTDDYRIGPPSLAETIICISLGEHYPKTDSHHILAAGFIEFELSNTFDLSGKPLMRKTGKDHPREINMAVSNIAFERPKIENDSRLWDFKWFWHTEENILCEKCDNTRLHIFAAHERFPRGGNAKPQHTFSAYCAKCNTAYPPATEAFREKLSATAISSRPLSDSCSKCN